MEGHRQLDQGEQALHQGSQQAGGQQLPHHHKATAHQQDRIDFAQSRAHQGRQGQGPAAPPQPELADQQAQARQQAQAWQEIDQQKPPGCALANLGLAAGLGIARQGLAAPLAQ